MELNDFIEELADLMDVEQDLLKLDTKLADLEDWTSLTVVGFIAFVDESFDTQLKPAKIRKCITVGDLVGLLGDKIEQN